MRIVGTVAAVAVSLGNVAPATAYEYVHNFEGPPSGFFRDYRVSIVDGEFAADVPGVLYILEQIGWSYYDFPPPQIISVGYSVDRYCVIGVEDCDGYAAWRRVSFTATEIRFSVYTPRSYYRCDLDKAEQLFATICGESYDFSQAQIYGEVPDGSVVTLAVVGEGAVPEPASWALMIAGFGLTGLALRRRPAACAA